MKQWFREDYFNFLKRYPDCRHNPTDFRDFILDQQCQRTGCRAYPAWLCPDPGHVCAGLPGVSRESLSLACTSRRRLEPTTGLRKFSTCWRRWRDWADRNPSRSNSQDGSVGISLDPCRAYDPAACAGCHLHRHRRRFTEMTGVSLGVALLSFGIGFIVRQWLGVNM